MKNIGIIYHSLDKHRCCPAKIAPSKIHKTRGNMKIRTHHLLILALSGSDYQVLVRMEELESPTYWFVASHSIRLSYMRMRFTQPYKYSTPVSPRQRFFCLWIFKYTPSLQFRLTSNADSVGRLPTSRRSST